MDQGNRGVLRLTEDIYGSCGSQFNPSEKLTITATVGDPSGNYTGGTPDTKKKCWGRRSLRRPSVITLIILSTMCSQVVVGLR